MTSKSIECVRKLINDNGGCYTLSEVARNMKQDEADIREKVLQHEIIAVTFDGLRLLFPRFQFVDTGERPVPGLTAFLQYTMGWNFFDLCSFLLWRMDPDWSPRTPLDVLVEGRYYKACELANNYMGQV